jgi:hypothetical protein
MPRLTTALEMAKMSAISSLAQYELNTSVTTVFTTWKPVRRDPTEKGEIEKMSKGGV